MNNREESSSEEIFGGVCMEVAGIESCGFGVGPMQIPTNTQEEEQ